MGEYSVDPDCHTRARRGDRHSQLGRGRATDRQTASEREEELTRAFASIGEPRLATLPRSPDLAGVFALPPPQPSAPVSAPVATSTSGPAGVPPFSGFTPAAAAPTPVPRGTLQGWMGVVAAHRVARPIAALGSMTAGPPLTRHQIASLPLRGRGDKRTRAAFPTPRPLSRAEIRALDAERIWRHVDNVVREAGILTTPNDLTQDQAKMVLKAAQKAASLVDPGAAHAPATATTHT